MNQHHRKSGSATPLASTSVEIIISDLLAEYEVRHSFHNNGTEAIEAIYSFPVPLDAAFLGMQATLGEETLAARVVPAKHATREYDNAIADGDSAILIEQIEPGMLCVCLGALQAGEHGEIVLRFAATLGVAGRIARFSLPFVHRPRYGRSQLLDNGTYPTHDFAAEHPLKARIRIRGLLANRPVQCATHGAQFLRDGEETVLNLDKAMLDRDLVLSFDLGADSVSSLRRIRDGDRSIGVLNFVVPLDARETAAPRDICLMLDCSGSMQGDAIEQSRATLRALAGELGDDDRIQVIRFGDHTVPLFRRPLRASSRVRAALAELCDTVNADLGGTEMGHALGMALDALSALDGSTQQKVVILVTDGAVHARMLENATRDAARAGIRIFVVAVGSSAGVDVLLPLAAATNATLERAVPAEPIDAGVLRQLRRAREPGPIDLNIDWGTGSTPLPHGIVYPGDAITALAFLSDNASRAIRANLPSSEQMFLPGEGAAEVSPAWRAWAGQLACRNAHGAPRESIALHYGLITPETSAMLVKVRAGDHKTDGLPNIVPVAHMTPAGMVSGGDHLCNPRPSPSQARYSPVSEDFDSHMDIAPLAQMTNGGGLFDALPDMTESSSENAQPPLPNERVALIEQALLRALFKLLFIDERLDISSDTLLAEIDAELHEDAVCQILIFGTMWNGALDTFELFDQLSRSCPAGTVPELTDDQEAWLALLRHSLT